MRKPLAVNATNDGRRDNVTNDGHRDDAARMAAGKTCFPPWMTRCQSVLRICAVQLVSESMKKTHVNLTLSNDLALVPAAVRFLRDSAAQMGLCNDQQKMRLAVALEEKGNPAEAIQHYNKALELAPKSIPTLTNLAWLLATSPDASLRNGLKAVEFAKQADRLVAGTNALVLRTLAAAYAENGEFANAIGAARSAIQLARMHNEDALTADLSQQITLYELGLPFRTAPK